MAVTTRSGKGSALTHSEMDTNLNQIPNGSNSSITDDGTNVGIGTSSPAAKLEVTGVIKCTSSNVNSTSSTFTQTSPAFTSGSMTKYGLRINSGNDDFDFGHFTDVGGSAGTIIDTSGTNIGIIIRSDTNGVRLANTATSWSSYSDSRLKNVSGDIDASIDKIKAMRGVYYTLKDDASPTPTNRVGVIAQEVQAVLPEAVDDDSDFMQVRYTDIIPVLIEAVKEQQVIIEALEARVTALEPTI
jgi:hypothetical protein